MKFFTHIKALLQDMVEPPTLDQVISVQMQQAQAEILQCNHTIKVQSFLKHMAQARTNAMIAWVNQEQVS